jgi:hypothetical protein
MIFWVITSHPFEQIQVDSRIWLAMDGILVEIHTISLVFFCFILSDAKYLDISDPLASYSE